MPPPCSSRCMGFIPEERPKTGPAPFVLMTTAGQQRGYARTPASMPISRRASVVSSFPAPIDSRPNLLESIVGCSQGVAPFDRRSVEQRNEYLPTVDVADHRCAVRVRFFG